jgi:DNA-binding beta-propeller fold protein YncE
MASAQQYRFSESARGKSPRHLLGEMSFMKFRTLKIASVLFISAAALWLAGCGSKSVANVVTVSIIPSSVVVQPGLQQSFTATVNGSTTLTVTWTCSFVFTPLPTATTPNPTTTKPADCTNSSGGTINGGKFGAWTTTSANGSNVLTYTAPTLANFPSPIPTLTFTAAADADKKKTATAVINLDSGIRISVTPLTITVPVGLKPNQTEQFHVDLQNAPPLGLQWKLVQPNTASTTVVDQSPNPLSDSCDPTCGTMDAANNGIFTAPDKLPTDTKPAGSKSTLPTTVFAVVWNTKDPNHFAIATITLISASTHPVTFSGIYPTTAIAGSVEQDLFLDAHNLLNTTTITFTPPGPAGNATAIDSSNVFTIPITAAYCTPSASGVTPVVTCDASILTRIRLISSQLADPGVAQITVNNIPNTNFPNAYTVPAGCALAAGSKSTDQTVGVSCPLTLSYASPALVAAVPDSIPLGTSATFAADGGYYGGCTNPIMKLLIAGGLNPIACPTSTTRQIQWNSQGAQITQPGLYPVSLENNAPLNAQPPLTPPPFPTVTTNLAVQPVFGSVGTPISIPLLPAGATIGPNLAPSSIALNSPKGYALVTEQASNSLQLVDLSSGVPTVKSANLVSVGSAPTSVSIDDQIFANGHDLAAVVNSADNSLSLIDIPAMTLVKTVPLPSNLATGSTSSAKPIPYAIGVDPGTHRAVVAYSNTNLGFIVDLDSTDTTQTCFDSTQVVPCVISSVSMNTGDRPQIVMVPQSPLAYVTPGGGGVTSVVNLLQNDNIAHIAPSPNGAVRTNNVVTITTTDAGGNGINEVTGGTVLVSGVTPADLNGSYQVTLGTITPFTFSYTQTGTLANETGGGGTVTYGAPYYTFSTTNTAAGAAINSITRTFAFADPNATSSQIDFIGSLDQTVSSLTLTRGSCLTCMPQPPGAPENGLRSVAFDPFTNVLIAYNPQDNFNEISLINPGSATSTGSQAAYRIIAAIPTGQTGTGSYTPAGAGATPVTVFGPMTYDPKTRLVLIANAGSNNLSYLNLDQDPSAPFKKVQIAQVLVTSGGVANAQPDLGSVNKAVCDPTQPKNKFTTCMPQGVTLGKPATLRILGEGFKTALGAQVRLDASAANITTTVVSDNEVDASIPASLLITTHDFAMDVLVGGVTSNSTPLHAVGVIDLTPACAPTATFPQGPEAAAVDEIRRIAIVTNYACGSVSVINLDTAGLTGLYSAPYGAILGTVTVGKNPIGVAVISRLGFAVVANNADGTASILDISNPLKPKVVTWTPSGSTTVSTSVPVGVSPTAVAMDQDRALALVVNSGSGTLSTINLTVLLSRSNPETTTPSATTVALSGPPIAIAVDPSRSVAVVTNLQGSGSTNSIAGADVISLSSTPPARFISATISGLTSSPTGIALDPAVSPALFYITSTQANTVYSFNPDTSATSQIKVGINPFSVAYNYQTGAMLTVNSTSNTSSIVDTQGFHTRHTLGISSQSQFAAATDNLTNTVVMVDQNNNRVMLVPLP